MPETPHPSPSFPQSNAELNCRLMTASQRPTPAQPSMFLSDVSREAEVSAVLPPLRTPKGPVQHAYSTLPPKLLEPPSQSATTAVPTSPDQHSQKSLVPLDRLLSSASAGQFNFNFTPPSRPEPSRVYQQYRQSPQRQQPESPYAGRHPDPQAGNPLEDYRSPAGTCRTCDARPLSHVQSPSFIQNYGPIASVTNISSNLPQHPLEYPPQRPPPPLDERWWYHTLKVRQQPLAARACGFGERDRRVVDPPPIVELSVTNPQTGAIDLDELRHPFHVVHASLWNEAGTEDATTFVQSDKKWQRRLMGTSVASTAMAFDDNDKEGAFFCFPDLSCRTAGKYRLRFVMLRMDPSNFHRGSFTPVVADVISDVFTVYTAKEFPGMRPSTGLTRVLKRQGIAIQVKKGKQPSRMKRSLQESDEERSDVREDEPRKLQRFESPPHNQAV